MIFQSSRKLQKMTGSVDIPRLRGSNARQQAAILREASHRAEAASTITDQLLNAVREERIPASIIQIWLSIVQSPSATVAAVRQPHNALVRQGAILLLSAHLRRAESFSETWDALDGADGIVKLLSELSVRDVRALLKSFRATAYSPIAREERQKRMMELFDQLSDPEKNPETRPLKVHYSSIIPACTQDVALRWTRYASNDSIPEWRSVRDSNPEEMERLQKRIRKAHREAMEQQLFDIYFGPQASSLDLWQLRPFVARSKRFGIKVVGVFAQSDTLRGFTAKSIMESVVLETARHCSRRRTPSNLDSQFWSDLLTCLTKHPSLTSGNWMVLNDHRSKSLLHYTAMRWNHSRMNSQDDDSLKTLIGLIPDQFVKHLKLDDLLRAVSSGLRCTVLHLFYQNARPYKLDIGPSGDSLAGIEFNVAMFLYLSSIDAAALFERYRLGNPKYGSLVLHNTSRQPSNISLFEHDKKIDEALCPDGNALRAYLHTRAWAEPDSSSFMEDPAPIFEDLRVNELDRRRMRSAQGSEPEVRSCWAVAALCLCVAMGDLDAYADTWTWTRRFLRDRVTVASIYTGRLLQNGPGIDILVVLSEAPTAVAGFEEKLQKANKTILLLVETATMALREPHFNAYDWRLILELASTVVNLRLRRCAKMQDVLGWSDEEMLDKILRPSVDLLVETETLLLKPQHKRLKKQQPHGLLQPIARRDLPEPRPYIVTFLDTLAQRRNELWERRRSQIDPNVITLEEPWPRGLPIQCLWYSPRDSTGPWESARHLLWHSVGADYLQSRAHAVVFCDKDIVLAAPPAAQDIQKAIGSFVDSWTYALRIYVGGADGQVERQQRIDKALQHAMGPLTSDRMTPDDALRFWHAEFVEAGIKWGELPELNQSRREPAKLPDPDPSRSPVEWNPDPEFQEGQNPPAKRKHIEGITCLDCMLQAPQLNPRLWESQKATQVEAMYIPAEVPQAMYWSMRWPDETAGGQRQGSVDWSSPNLRGDLMYSRMAAAILCVNSAYGADTSLLMTPFPDEKEPVFPAMYLDQDFLEREGKVDRGSPPKAALADSRNAIPPTLLVRLAASIQQRLRQEKSEGVMKYGPSVFVSVLQHAIYGPRPSAVLPLLRDFVVEFVQDSAWHRELLHLGILDRLSAKDAEEFFFSLATAITDMLKQQKEKLHKQQKPSDGKAPQAQLPLVKVTTVKMIAQLLRIGVFVRPGLAVDVLSQILRNGSHVDIQIAAIEALISASGDAALKPQIMDMLETYAVSLASALNERDPETEAEWLAAEDDGEMPLLDTKNRVLNMFIERSTASETMYLSLADLALQQSAGKHVRWTSLFLRKHGLELDVDILPKIPVDPGLLRQKMDAVKPAAISVQDFNTMRNYILFRMRDVKALQKANSRVRKNTELCRTNAGKHWLKIWDGGSSAGLTWGGSWAVGLLARFAKLDRDNEPSVVPYKMVEDFVLEIGITMIDRGDLKGFDTFRKMLVIPRDEVHEDRGYAKITRLLIQRIDSLRTPEWQADPKRQPPVLPATLPLRLELIPFYHDMPERNIASTADILISMLREIQSGRVPYFDKYQIIEKHVSSQSVLPLAVLLGSLSKMDDPEDPTPVDYLRARLAAKIIESRPRREKHSLTVLQSLELMLGEWRASSAEELRTLAEKLPHTLRTKEATTAQDRSELVVAEVRSAC